MNKSILLLAGFAFGLVAASGDEHYNIHLWEPGKVPLAVGDGPLITDDKPLPEYFLLRRLQDPNAPRLTFGTLQALLR